MRTLLLGAVLAACSAVPHAIGEVSPGRWTTTLGDLRNAGALAEHAPTAPRPEWDVSLGRGLPVQPIVQGDLVVGIVSGGGVVTASATTGRRFWSRRFNGAVADQAVRVDDRVFFATQHRDGNVYALDLRRGRRLWTYRLGARAAAGAAWADGTLYVPTDRGELVALDATNGVVQWRSRIAAVATQPPLVVGDELVIATTRDSLLRVDRTGTVRARLAIAGEVSAPLTAAGDTLVLVMHPGIVAAYAERGVREVWRHDTGAPVLAAPVVAPEGVYVLARDARLLRATASGVQVLAAPGGAATASLTVSANCILVGRLDGSLLCISRVGQVTWQQELTGSLRAPVAVAGGAVYAASLAGRLVKLVE